MVKLNKYDLDNLSASCMSLDTEQEAQLFGPLLHTHHVIQEKTNVIHLRLIWCHSYSFHKISNNLF